MELKKIVVGISEVDIINFMKLQDKVLINEIKINDCIFAVGEFELLKAKIKFEAEFIIDRVEENSIYVNIKNFKVYKMKIINSIFKKAFNYLIKSFTEIEGISFEREYFKLEVTKLISKYYKEQELLDISKLEICNIALNEEEIYITFGGVQIDIKSIHEDIKDDKVPYIEADIVNDVEEEVAFTIDEIKEYEKDYNEESLFNKIKQYGKNAGVSVVYATLILYYTYMDKNVPLTAKAISLGALGYFIIPTDLIPDIILAVGYTDDLIALITSIKSIAAYINDDIKLKAQNRLIEWFETVNEKDLEAINIYF